MIITIQASDNPNDPRMPAIFYPVSFPLDKSFILSMPSDNDHAVAAE
jgi:hypothetical protein